MKPHKFFEQYVDNNLISLSEYIDNMYLEMKKKHYTDLSIPYDPGNRWLSFNIFNSYHEGLYNLQKTVSALAKEACEYYDINFNDKKYYMHGWFNYYDGRRYVGVDPDNLNYHDHNDSEFSFHGYYCLSAEPSTTYYKIDGKRFDNENKNNRAILSKNGYHHAPGPWDQDFPRVTIAYNIVPLNELNHNVQESGQFIPLL